jgi:hypothetical protein
MQSLRAAKGFFRIRIFPSSSPIGRLKNTAVTHSRMKKGRGCGAQEARSPLTVFAKSYYGNTTQLQSWGMKHKKS